MDRFKKGRERDAAYVESIRDSADRDKQSADHRALVIGDLAHKLRAATARIRRAEAVVEAAIRCGMQLGKCDHGIDCQDPECELRELLHQFASPPREES